MGYKNGQNQPYLEGKGLLSETLLVKREEAITFTGWDHCLIAQFL